MNREQSFRAGRVKVDLGENSYEIFIGSGILPYLGLELSRLKQIHGWGRKALVISNPTVAHLYGQQVFDSLREGGFKPYLALMNDGEQYKTMDTAMDLFDQALDGGFDRKSLIVALGGGVTGDLAGFVAATYMRGIPFVQVPTSLLAQVDSSVGGKVAVNHPRGKNIIGAFYQPRLVWADVDVLKSLPEDELKAGLAEVIKYGLIWNPEFFDYLQQHTGEILALAPGALKEIVQQSCAIKAGVVAEDERELGLRAILNLGHTFGHAFEALTNYREYRHGEAVAIGMVLAARVSEGLGMLTMEETARIKAVIQGFGLPVNDRTNQNPQAVLESMTHDKKAEGGHTKYILPQGIGKVIISADVPQDQILRVLES